MDWSLAVWGLLLILWGAVVLERALLRTFPMRTLDAALERGKVSIHQVGTADDHQWMVMITPAPVPGARKRTWRDGGVSSWQATDPDLRVAIKLAMLNSTAAEREELHPPNMPRLGGAEFDGEDGAQTEFDAMQRRAWSLEGRKDP
jgi:hypothetical protein